MLLEIVYIVIALSTCVAAAVVAIDLMPQLRQARYIRFTLAGFFALFAMNRAAEASEALLGFTEHLEDATSVSVLFGRVLQLILIAFLLWRFYSERGMPFSSENLEHIERTISERGDSERRKPERRESP